MRSFNTAGPVKPDKHYCIPPLGRIDLDEVLRLVRDERYFVLHAPRQTGKTSALLALAEVLNGRGYRCVYVTFETARTARDDVQRAMRTVLVRLASQARATLDDGFLDEVWPDILAHVGPDEALGETLSRWAQASPGPLVLLIDEIDTLVGDSLLSVLQQLRAGYPTRPERFPHSVVLCGMRDLRDYRMGAAGSPFNIAAKSLRLGDFSRRQTLALLGQHTEQTGQAFAPEAREAVWTHTRGQPWLVNALAYGVCFEDKTLREDRSRTVTADDIVAVREELNREPGDPPRLPGRQAARGARTAGDRADAQRHPRARLHGPRCRVRARPRATGPRRADTGGQPDLRRGAAARTRVGGAGDAGAAAAALREGGRQPGRRVADEGKAPASPNTRHGNTSRHAARMGHTFVSVRPSCGTLA